MTQETEVEHIVRKILNNKYVLGEVFDSKTKEIERRLAHEEERMSTWEKRMWGLGVGIFITLLSSLGTLVAVLLGTVQ